MNCPSSNSSVRRAAVSVRGVVQGVGFRPFVYRTAVAGGLTGFVANDSDTVRIEAQGAAAAIDAFIDAIRRNHPPQALVDGVEVAEIPAVENEYEFRIVAGSQNSLPGPVIPADLATCAECLAEINDQEQRRHGYPFTNCTNCGPRWSIIERLPYDRPGTSMSGFSMCDDCRAEYENPADRRFHAQPIACPRCGPKLQLLDGGGQSLAQQEVTLSGAVAAILGGRIVALKGLGGFQLLADATNEDAVVRLRDRKRRPDRPLAIMLPTIDDVRLYCHLSNGEATALISHQSPIVLLHKRLPSSLCDAVAPQNPYLGVMLPYTPLHHLLMSKLGRPVVCTSGNLSEEPMAISTEDALQRLGAIADVFLTHDRPIVRAVDDSIVRFGPVGMQVLRRSRGFAPLPIKLSIDGDRVPTILAVGGHLKNTAALLIGNAKQVVMSAHIGDLDSRSSVDAFRKTVSDLVDFFRVAPDAVACDLHPDYASTRHAEQLAAAWGVPLVRVQHHHAHAAACMAENSLPGPVLAFSWDGTGYGPDGTIWGGEALLCKGSTFERIASLRTFSLPGGDRAAREPRRSALGVLYEILGEAAAEYAATWFTKKELAVLMSMMSHGVNSPRTSSMGRLYDAVAAICGLRQTISFEGQAAMSLEFAADENEPAAYFLPVCEKAGLPALIDWAPLVREVLADREQNVPVGRISAKFHNALAKAAMIIALNERLPVVLSGGCFQNDLLLRRVFGRLFEAGIRVYNHKEVPPGDGGIALGQISVALEKLQESSDVPRYTR